MIIIPELHSGCTDSHGARSMRLASAVEIAGEYTVTMDRLTLAVANVPAIQTLVPSQDLIHMCYYSVGIQYRDRAPNDPVLVTRVGVLYDILTETPTLTAPASSTIITTEFDVIFVLPEKSQTSSFQLTLTRVSGIADAGSPHVVTFLDNDPNTYTRKMSPFATMVSAPVSGGAVVESVTSNSGTASNLVDGTTYDFNLRYVDEIGNTEATDATSTIFFAGSATLTPTFARPAANIRLPQQFVIDFTLDEPAYSGTLTMTFTPSTEYGASDSNNPRVITFDSSFETSGRHQLSTDRLSTLSSLAGVTSVSPAVDLINDGVYDVVLSYQDTAQHPAVIQTHVNITFDTTTSAPTLLAPATSSRAKTTFNLEFELPENALPNTLTLDVRFFAGGIADSVETRTILFDSTVDVIGTHQFTMTNLSLAASTVNGIASVTPEIDFVHGAFYIFTIKYQDFLGNDQAQDAATSVLYDTHTVSPVFISPLVGDFIRVDFGISFALLEPALAGTVVLEIHPTGQTTTDHAGSSLATSIDTGTDLTLLFSSAFETISTHTIGAMTNLLIATSSISSVSSITPTARDLLHGNIYDLTLSYRDQAENIRASVIHTAIKFDTVTEPPELILPATGSYLRDPFLVEFTLREVAKASSLILKIISTNTGEIDAVATRTLTLQSAQESFGNRQFNLGPSLSTSASTNAVQVLSILPATDLVDGCVYEFRLQYADVADNTAAYQDVLNVAYAGTATLVPSLSSPAASSAVKANFLLDFSLKEVALPGSLQLRITPSSGSSNVQDHNGTRVVTFASTIEGRGGHLVEILNLSTAAIQSSNIDDVTPPIDLKVGALYDLELSYQDAAGNPASSVTHTSIAFAGNATLSPVLIKPQTFDFVGDAFDVKFNLPERSKAGTVKLIFDYDVARSVVADGIATRTVNFDHSFTAEAGTYQISFPTMSTANQLSSVTSVYPDVDLVDGGVYTLRLEYVIFYFYLFF